MSGQWADNQLAYGEMKTKRLSNHISQILLFTTEPRYHYKYLNWDILHFYPQNELILNLMPATGLRKVGMGQQMAEKVRHFKKIQLGEHLSTNEVD